MTVRERVVRGTVASEHIVQFFDSDESRAECVAGFLADGIANREPAIIVAKPPNWAATIQQMEAQRTPFVLLCGYSAAHFVATTTHRALREICGAHSSVHRHPQDPLATWLLNSAHDTPGAGAIAQ